MNDLEIMKDIFKKRNIEFTEEKFEIGVSLTFYSGNIGCVGCTGFCSVLNFDLDGSLETVGSWE